jgi:phosphomannomutase
MDRLMVSVSGVRGTIGATLTADVANDFGRAFAQMLGAGSTVVLGMDTRPSGPMIRSAVVAGLSAGGVNAVDLGVVTTPGVALMTRKLGAAGGVVITASHNPPQYNGIKFLQASGTGLTAAGAGRLKEIWEAGQFPSVGVGELGTLSEDASTHDAHVEIVCSICDPEKIAAGGFRVVVDSINGAGCAVTPMLLEKLGCELVHLNGEPTGDFAHAPEPIEENLGGLCEAVREHGAAIGFAQDPDADRLVVVDERGRFIGEEYTLALATAFVLRGAKGKVAANLATSRMIDDIAAAAGCEVVRAPTGEANVAEAMQREGCIFGGEGNGGVIDPRVVPVRDSLVGMAMLLQYLADTGQPLSELADAIPSYVVRKTKMPCPAGAADEVVGATRDLYASRDDAILNDSDGLRVDVPEGWLCVRASNTEPIMRIIAEARDEKTVDAMVAQVARIAENIIG